MQKTFKISILFFIMASFYSFSAQSDCDGCQCADFQQYCIAAVTALCPVAHPPFNPQELNTCKYKYAYNTHICSAQCNAGANFGLTVSWK